MELRILREDRPLELAQPRPGSIPSSSTSACARVLVGLEGLGLALRAVEGEHQLRVQALALRVLADQRLELADQLGVAAQRQLGLDPLLERGEAQLVEPGDLACAKGS